MRPNRGSEGQDFHQIRRTSAGEKRDDVGDIAPDIAVCFGAGKTPACAHYGAISKPTVIRAVSVSSPLSIGTGAEAIFDRATPIGRIGCKSALSVIQATRPSVTP